MALPTQQLKEFITSQNPLYHKYAKDWRMTYNAYVGGVEWRNGLYLKQYKTDTQTESGVVDIITDEGKHYQTFTQFDHANTTREAENGLNVGEGTFYYEKLHSTPLFPYVRLYVSEYNSILFNRGPDRELSYDYDNENNDNDYTIHKWCRDVDGEKNSINEFMSQVDVLSTVFGVVWVSCYKPRDNDTPLWNIHTPLQVNNWKYAIDRDGKKYLKMISIKIQETQYETVYKVYTPETIETIFVPHDTNDDYEYQAPDGLVEDEGIYRDINENELGYIPVVPIYQSMKVYDGVGHTPMFDISQCQRAIYNYTAEIYSGIAYGSNPVLVADKATLALNNNYIPADPGATVKVESPDIAGQGGFTLQYIQPSVEALDKIQDYIDSVIEKMNTTAMIRSEDLIKASRSGAQIEQYDSKLEAFIRKKATALENAELSLWYIWHDWMNKEMSEEFRVEYPKTYGKKSLEQDIKNTAGLMELIGKYKELSTSEEVIYPHYMINPEDGEEVLVYNDTDHTEYANKGWVHHQDLVIQDMEDGLKHILKHLFRTSYNDHSQE